MTNSPSQRLFASLVQALPLPVCVIDHTRTIRYYNQQWRYYLSFREGSLSEPLHRNRNTLTGKLLDDVQVDPELIHLVQQSIEAGDTRKGEYTTIGSTEIAWKVTVTPLADSGSTTKESKSRAKTLQTTMPTYFLVTVEDVTALRRLERVQRDFIANLSHELRTPLTTVRLLAETLEDVMDVDPDKAQSFVEKIEREMQYLTNIVSDLLELSGIEAGQVPMAIESVEGERLVREVMARMLPLAQRHRVTLRTDIEQGKTLVAADSKQITRVLVNLVHNAIKYTPSGGKITIGTLAQESEHMQKFFVRDTGVGIRAEELPRIFERFYKTDRARSKGDFVSLGTGGTGLGLAIARQVVEAHGGRIGAESIFGEGSIFTFTLPMV